MTNGWKGALIGALAWAVALTVVADSAEKEGDKSPEVRAGLALAEEECAACHAIARDDVSPESKAPAFRDLYKRYPVEQLEEALAEGIVTGHEGMPEIAWEPEQISAFIAYLKDLRG
ncbi:cytochrome c [Breoghania sp.]|uniref:c-type cytochrome n=1 Tax=Breoghania sp. TaxID=2065378 RepID=UPI002636BFD0|nr:cytochrome c [Breoghania sp.]MDJ0932001.1 cytochrome c [Breoghania sp.]